MYSNNQKKSVSKQKEHITVSFFIDEYLIGEGEQFPCNLLFIGTQQSAEMLRELYQLTVCMDTCL